MFRATTFTLVIAFLGTLALGQEDQQTIQYIKQNADGTPAKIDEVVYPTASADPENLRDAIDATEKAIGRELITLLASNKSLQQDLELVDYQRERIEQSWSRFNDEVDEFKARVSKLSAQLQEEPDNAACKKELDQLRSEQSLESKLKEHEELISDVLLDHQIDRLHSMASYLAVRDSFLSNSDPVQLGVHYCRVLGLDAEEIRQIKNKADDIVAEYKRKVQEAADEARKEFLKAIPERKRDEMKKIMDGDYLFLKELGR
ncbi:MAG: hypothetical protein R3C03_15015 [Pirellulaceae bacterium]